MLKNYLLVAWRNLWRNRTYSLLNILGLSVGMAVAILILLWIFDELNYDRFHEKVDNIALLHQHQHYEGEIFTFTSMPPPLAEQLEEEIPEVKDAVRTSWGNETLLSAGEQRFYQNVLAVDSSFLEVFSFPLLDGHSKTVLKDPRSIVISAEVAQKIFGTTDAVGQTLKYNNVEAFTVSGVLAPMPKNTIVKFDALIPFRTYVGFNSDWLSLTEWGNNNTQIYVELRNGAELAQVNRKIKDILKKRIDPDGKGSRPAILMFPFAKERLYGNWEDGKNVGGRISYVRWFSILAFFVLIIACVNFMNLATARASRRSREIGIRKSIGAARGRIMTQFLGESILMTALSMLLAIGLVWLALGPFNELTEKKLQFRFWEPQLLGLMMGAMTLLGLIAGLYPAVYLSGFQVVKVLKGAFRSGTAALNFRKGLVVFQFVLCSMLIIGSILVFQQIRHIQNRPIGYNRENVLRVPIRGDLGSRYQPLREELKRIKGVESHSTSGMNITGIHNSTSSLNWPGRKPNDQILFVNQSVDPNYLKTFDIKLKEGRDFREGDFNDTLSLLFNETAIKRMGLKGQVLGAVIKLWDMDCRIIGVMEDFHYNSINSPIEPLFFYNAPNWRNNAVLRLDQEARPLSETIDDIKAVYKKHNPAYPFEYEFVDDDFNALFKSEQLIGKLAQIFAFLAIFVACLGLFGLASFSAEQRTKEIGVRKVLGASLTSIVNLMAREFLILVGVALLIASPLAWYVMNGWLSKYAYHIDISPWVFVAVAALTLGIAFLTVTFQSLKAALIDPVKSLKSE
jgi:putative ABC transport system permease protein